MPRVFISHSTRTPRAEAFLQAVAKRLEGAFVVHLDRTGLKAGADWREEIYTWMDRAHAAVLVLTPEALRSDFVAIEASVLAWRKFRHPDFVLVPVLVDVAAGDLRAGVLGELDLLRIQAVRANTPEEAAEEVLKTLQPLADQERPRTPGEVFEASVAKLLRDGSVDAADLREAGQRHLGWNVNDAGADRELERAFAKSLLAAPAVHAYRAIRELAERRVKGAPELLDLVAPIWVAEERAQPVAYQARADPAQRVLVLDLTGDRADEVRDWTLVSYIGRAYYQPLEHPYRVCELAPPREEDAVEDLKAQIFSAFRPRNRFAAQASRETIKEAIALREETLEPVFAVFKTWVPDPPVLRALREEFGTITFFVLGGGCPVERLRALSRPGRFMEPVQVGAERNVFLEYGNTYDFVSGGR
jgi:hypothetical protein